MTTRLGILLEVNARFNKAIIGKEAGDPSQHATAAPEEKHLLMLRPWCALCFPRGWSTGEQLHNNAGRNADTDAESLNVTTGGIVHLARLCLSHFSQFYAPASPARQLFSRHVHIRGHQNIWWNILDPLPFFLLPSFPQCSYMDVSHSTTWKKKTQGLVGNWLRFNFPWLRSVECHELVASTCYSMWHLSRAEHE